jgi:hypothetical protein
MYFTSSHKDYLPSWHLEEGEVGSKHPVVQMQIQFRTFEEKKNGNKLAQTPNSAKF